MGRITSSLDKSFKWFRQSLATIFLAPFVAIAAVVGLVVIGISQMLRALEAFIAMSGHDINLGSQYLKKVGKKQLPSFYF